MARRLAFDGRSLEVWNVKAFQELYTALDAVRKVAVRQRPLGLVTGPAGSGKTFTANVYVANAKADAVLVTTPPRDILTARIMLESIAIAMGIEPQSYRLKSELYDAVLDAVQERNAFLIIDEADRLRASNADMLREIAEVTGKPLCYLGCPTVEAILARVPATHHRIGFRHSVLPVELDDLETALVNRALDADGKRKLDRETVSAIYDCTRGNLRHVESLVHLLRVAQRQGAPVELTPTVVKQLNKRFLRQAA